MKTPILFIIFNRPQVTEKVFEAIRQARPEKLFIAADGPRDSRPGEKERCLNTRAIIKKVDWECEIHTKYSDVNLGCKKAVSSAITWFFEAVEEGIILEDDTLPDQSFFRFCEEMLEKFRDDPRIIMVTGDNFLGEWKSDIQSYHFISGGIWGWATWRRAWKLFDVTIQDWGTRKGRKAIRESQLIISKKQYREIKRLLDLTYYFPEQATWWGYQWLFARYKNNGLTVAPSKNLVRNIGFDSEATHTSSETKEASLPVFSLDFPLRHNLKIEFDKEFEEKELSLSYKEEKVIDRVRGKMVNIKFRIKIFIKKFIQ